MKVVGITGGVGSGKSEILSYLSKKCVCRVLLADQIAHLLEEPGQICYNLIVELLGNRILNKDGEIDKKKFAEVIFADEEILNQVNGIIHPKVKTYLCNVIQDEREKQELDYLFIEAALLIENGYNEIVDEMWYIHTDIDVRRDRLKRSRGYSDEKIDNIMAKQLTEKEFFDHSDFVLENSDSLEAVYKQIDEKLRVDLCLK